MNKIEKMKLIKEMCYKIDYQLMDGTHERPKHIRLPFGDVWPTTGTLKLNSEKNFYKGERGFYKLAAILNESISLEAKKESMGKRISFLESQNKDLVKQIKELTDCLEVLMVDVELLKC